MNLTQSFCRVFEAGPSSGTSHLFPEWSLAEEKMSSAHDIAAVAHASISRGNIGALRRVAVGLFLASEIGIWCTLVHDPIRQNGTNGQ